MKAGINIWRALHDIKDVHPAWAHVAKRRYTEDDLPRPISRKEDVGTLTGTKEVDEAQGTVTRTNWGTVDGAVDVAVVPAGSDQSSKADKVLKADAGNMLQPLGKSIAENGTLPQMAV
jgi:hypothetical protein